MIALAQKGIYELPKTPESITESIVVSEYLVFLVWAYHTRR